MMDGRTAGRHSGCDGGGGEGNAEASPLGDGRRGFCSCSINWLGMACWGVNRCDVAREVITRR